VSLVSRQKKHELSRAALVGIGPGLELALIERHCRELHAVDLHPSAFISERYPRIPITRSFDSVRPTSINTLFLIEILEHVVDPKDIIRQAVQRLRRGGKLVFTTVIDILQFDHLY